MKLVVLFHTIPLFVEGGGEGRGAILVLLGFTMKQPQKGYLATNFFLLKLIYIDPVLLAAMSVVRTTCIYFDPVIQYGVNNWHSN